MSLPERPGAHQPSFEERTAFRNSPSRRSRPGDVEAIGYAPVDSSAHPHRSHQRGNSIMSANDTIPGSNRSIDREPLSPTSPGLDGEFSSEGGGVSRKRSLIRPERNRINKDHPNYHYRKHAANMDVHPST